MNLLGHVVGVVAIGLFFYSYQIFDKKKLLLVQTIATCTLCLQYILIGAFSGFALNIVCVIRNVLYYLQDRKVISIKGLPNMLAFAMLAVSIFSWDGYHSLFIIVGLIMNTIFMGIFNSQDLRKSMLITCPMILVYNIFSFSISGIVSESLSIVSALIGIARYNSYRTEKQ